MDMGTVRNILLCSAVFVLSCAVMGAQTDRREVRKGNRDFRKENYSEAEIDYRRALVKDSTSFAANYNLGNTLYRNGDVQQARKSYETLKDAADASRYGADYYYNLGNAAAAMKRNLSIILEGISSQRVQIYDKFFNGSQAVRYCLSMSTR